jgi:hypothetical protein
MADEKSKRAGMSFSNEVKFTMEEGEVIQGEIVGLSVQKTDEDDRDYNLYHLKTDGGLVKCTLSHSIWDNIKDNIFIGDEVRITFKCQKDIGEGRRMNLYDIEIVKEGAGLVTLATALRPPKAKP